MSKNILSLHHPHVWRASEGLKDDSKRVSTGFKNLDSMLDGGLPSAGLIRLRSLPGIGELTFLRHPLGSNLYEKLTMLINPPGQIHASWLHNNNINPAHVRLLTPASSDDALWAAEQSLKSEACHMVIIWINGLSPKQARRLQVAASQHHTLCVLFESVHLQRQSLPLTLDLTLSSHPTGLHIEVTKYVGGRSNISIDLELRYTPDNTMINQLLYQKQPASGPASVAG